jgi:hypothetical protein
LFAEFGSRYIKYFCLAHYQLIFSFADVHRYSSSPMWLHFFYLASVSNNVPWILFWSKLFIDSLHGFAHFYTICVVFTSKGTNLAVPIAQLPKRTFKSSCRNSLAVLNVPNKYQPIAH